MCSFLFQLLGVNSWHIFSGHYKLLQSQDVIESLKVTETIANEIALKKEAGTLVKSTQLLELEGENTT
jgi:hypothetical protein